MWITLAGEDCDFGREAVEAFVIEELTVFGGAAGKESYSSPDKSGRRVGVVRGMLSLWRNPLIAESFVWPVTLSTVISSRGAKQYRFNMREDQRLRSVEDR